MNAFISIFILLVLSMANSHVITKEQEPVKSGTNPTQEKDSTAYSNAWEDSSKAIIIDAYGPNRINWEELVTDKRVIAIIHKSSEGLYKDDKYISRKSKAKQLGLKWGSYHLGRRGNPIKQADHYLQHIQDSGDELIALDLEDPRNKKYMTLKEAELFITRIYEKTNRYPLLYCNHLVMKMISTQYEQESVFAKCPLWYARFNSKIKNFDKRLWKSYSLWQFSSEINCKKTGTCLYNVPGTKYDMDVNVYNGSIEQLKNKWPNL